MQIINPSAAWLSNYEVFEHLKTRKDARDALAASLKANQKHPPTCPENVQTVEFEVLKYLESSPSARFDAQKMEELLAALLPFSLTKAEKLQIINLLPQSVVEFYLIVEECDERFTGEQIEEILQVIQRIVPPTEA